MPSTPGSAWPMPWWCVADATVLVLAQSHAAAGDACPRHQTLHRCISSLARGARGVSGRAAYSSTKPLPAEKQWQTQPSIGLCCTQRLLRPWHPQVWQDALRSKAQSPYMSHTLANGVLNGFRFCPYEDVLGIGHSEGFSTILIPGACLRAASHASTDALLAAAPLTGRSQARPVVPTPP